MKPETQNLIERVRKVVSKMEGKPIVVKVYPSNIPRMTILKDAVCAAFDLPWSEVVMISRKGERPLAKMIFSYIAKTEFGISLTRIGREFGQDHSTVKYHVNTIQDRLDVGEQLVTEKLNFIKEYFID